MQLPKISGKSTLAAAIRYALGRIPKARAYLTNGQLELELDNNICERSIRPVTLGRKNYLFMGSKGGGDAAAITYTLIETSRMNSVDPEAWECHELCVSELAHAGFRYGHALKRSSNMIAN